MQIKKTEMYQIYRENIESPHKFAVMKSPDEIGNRIIKKVLQRD